MNFFHLMCRPLSNISNAAFGCGWLDTSEGETELQTYAQSIGATPDELLVAQLDSEQRKLYEVSFKTTEHGTYLYYQGEPLNTATIEAPLTEEEIAQGERKSIIFVLGLDQKLYVAEHKISRFHHSSFFSGQPVVCGGEIKTDPNGKILEITDKSGHYKPREINLLKLLSFLDRKKVDLTDVTLVKKPKKLMRDAHGVYAGRYSASDFLRTKGLVEASPNINEDFF